MTIIKRFTYRDDSMEEFSNHYLLSGATPADDTEWNALFTALSNQERSLFAAGVEIVRAYGYNSPADNAVAVWAKDLTVAPNSPLPGQLSAVGIDGLPGDVAFWVRWNLDRRNTRGRPVYLRKYFHGAFFNTTDGDEMEPSQKAAAADFADALYDGTFYQSRTVVDKLGNVPIGKAVSTYVTTRTLKRRGKRPPT